MTGTRRAARAHDTPIIDHNKVALDDTVQSMITIAFPAAFSVSSDLDILRDGHILRTYKPQRQ
jgi:hypothetical protein